MTTTTWVKDVRRALEAEADPVNKLWGEKYFLGAIEFIGVKGPRTKAIERTLRPAWKAASAEERAAFALKLLRSRYMEERQIAMIVLLPLMKQPIGVTLLDDIERVFDDTVRDWATCDGLCSTALRWLLPNAAARKRIKAWSRTGEGAARTWKQRASAVAYVNEARHGQYDDDVIEVCSRIVKNPERFVQLGCGWVLRELSLADRPRVLQFIDDHAQHLSREGLRYATEKLPAPVKKTVHARHAQLSGRGRA